MARRLPPLTSGLYSGLSSQHVTVDLDVVDEVAGEEERADGGVDEVEDARLREEHRLQQSPAEAEAAKATKKALTEKPAWVARGRSIQDLSKFMKRK